MGKPTGQENEPARLLVTDQDGSAGVYLVTGQRAGWRGCTQLHDCSDTTHEIRAKGQDTSMSRDSKTNRSKVDAQTIRFFRSLLTMQNRDRR